MSIVTHEFCWRCQQVTEQTIRGIECSEGFACTRCGQFEQERTLQVPENYREDLNELTIRQLKAHVYELEKVQSGLVRELDAAKRAAWPNKRALVFSLLGLFLAVSNFVFIFWRGRR